MKKISATLLTFFLVGCQSKLPDCGDPNSIALLKQIVVEQISNSDLSGLTTEQVILENIETIEKSESPQKHLCAASIRWKLRSESHNYFVNLVSIKSNSIFNPEALLSILVDQKKPDPNAVKEVLPILIGATLSDQTMNASDSAKEGIIKSLIDTPAIAQETAAVFKKPFIDALNQASSISSELLSNEGVVGLSNEKIKYTIRFSEDKGSKGDFIVESRFPEPTISVIQLIETLTKWHAIGEKYIKNKAPTQAIQPAPQTAPQPAEPSAPEAPSQAHQPAPPAAPQAASQPAPQAVAVPPSSSAQASKDSPQFAPSFDCAKATSGQDHLVCGNSTLSKLDVELNTAYARARAASSDKAKLKSDQLEWFKFSRNACSDSTCLEKAYKDRIQQLTK